MRDNREIVVFSSKASDENIDCKRFPEIPRERFTTNCFHGCDLGAHVHASDFYALGWIKYWETMKQFDSF